MHPGVRRKAFLGPAIDAAKNAGAADFAREVERMLETKNGA
jgi:hypothetical protein